MLCCAVQLLLPQQILVSTINFVLSSSINDDICQAGFPGRDGEALTWGKP